MTDTDTTTPAEASEAAPDDTVTTPEPVDTPPEQPEPTGSDEDDAKPSSANAEAAKYRRQLRDTETERDRLADRLAVAQRREAERHLSGLLHHPEDLWATGVDIDSLLDDDGNLDTSRLDQTVEGLRASRPHWFKPITADNRSLPQPALQLGATPTDDRPPASWHHRISDAVTRGR